jgi:hypothetical protein
MPEGMSLNSHFTLKTFPFKVLLLTRQGARQQSSLAWRNLPAIPLHSLQKVISCNAIDRAPSRIYWRL